MGVFRRNRAALGIPTTGSFADVPRSVATLPPGDPALQPIAGIDLRRYATLARAVADLGEPAPGAVAGLLAHHGVTAEAWADAAAGWPRRIARNRALSVLFSQVSNAVQA